MGVQKLTCDEVVENEVCNNNVNILPLDTCTVAWYCFGACQLVESFNNGLKIIFFAIINIIIIINNYF